LEILKGGDFLYMKIDDKLALNLFHVDKEPHIKLNQDICRKCPHKACTRVCPVENYTLNDDGEWSFPGRVVWNAVPAMWPAIRGR
jgi:ferredoxin-like protein FixX